MSYAIDTLFGIDARSSHNKDYQTIFCKVETGPTKLDQNIANSIEIGGNKVKGFDSRSYPSFERRLVLDS